MRVAEMSRATVLPGKSGPRLLGSPDEQAPPIGFECEASFVTMPEVLCETHGRPNPSGTEALAYMPQE
jgi:hypothetical protein